ncbi:MAG: winged helix DNA-binding domain-containing protein [Propionibacteriaceae bacterium]|jgi:uncharacterized protein YcaQ|nr:winged helix DNA-binding domain-containing protein [Propionibacteriaceae bacterium]
MKLAQARRVALAAQGFGQDRPAAVGLRQAQRVIGQLGQFQIDSVNVCVRAQYVPMFARLGPYPMELLDNLGGKAPRRLFEYWGHAASLIDVALYPALRQRMDDWQPWPKTQAVLREKPELVDKVLRQVSDSGPLTARQIEHPDGRERRPWWNWSEAKHVLEWLLAKGRLAPSGRNSQFERLYDLAERVLPAQVLAAEHPRGQDAWTVLVRRAAQSLGIASERCLADYFRVGRPEAKAAVKDLVAAGELIPVPVDGWKAETYLWHQARAPRALHADALVSPFDSLVFERARLAALFGVDYRIEVYTPKPKRVYGYYVYLYVMDDRIAARVDLKADRDAGVLRVQAAWLEPGCPEAETAARLKVALADMSAWLGLGDVAVAPVGTLSRALIG